MNVPTFKAAKACAVSLFLAASALLGPAAAHADGIIAPPGGVLKARSPCDAGPVLEAPTLVGQVVSQFQVRGEGYCFTPGNFAYGQMFDSTGTRLDGADFVVYPNGYVEYILYVAQYSPLYCGFVGINIKFTDTANGRSASRTVCAPQLLLKP